MRFLVCFGVLVFVFATRLLSHTTGPGIGSYLTVLLVSCLYAAPPVAIWYAVDRRRKPQS